LGPPISARGGEIRGDWSVLSIGARMADASSTLLKLDDEMTRLWDARKDDGLRWEW